MTCTNYWIASSISFCVSIIMWIIGIFVKGIDAAVFCLLMNWIFAIAGWVLWIIGLVNYIRNR